MKAGQTILFSVAAFTAVGGFLFDWNKTHLFNPKWTPHAKFHDGMTITLGLLLGTSSLYLLTKKENKENKLLSGTILPSYFWVSMASGFVYPGAKGLEAEFPNKIKKVGGIPLNEVVVSGLMLSLLGIGYALTKKNK